MLFVGRISKEKNLDTLVASTRRLAEWKTPARPLFIGDGPYLSEMKRLLPDALFTGYLRGEELADAYASADFFVFPSTTDTFGNVVLEAQASGLPVIVSDVGGPRDLVQHARDGFITKALDAGELAEAIRRSDGGSQAAGTHGSAGPRPRRNARLVGSLRKVLARLRVAKTLAVTIMPHYRNLTSTWLKPLPMRANLCIVAGIFSGLWPLITGAIRLD